MRVGHFVSFGIGGADRTAFNLLSGLKEIGIKPLIFYNELSLPKRTADQDSNQPLLSIKSLYEEHFELVRLENVADLNSHELDILHTHRSGEDEWLLPGLSSLPRTFKIVETNFHGYLETPADYRIFPSETLMQWRRIQPSDNNSVVHNPIILRDTDEDLRESLGIEPDAVVIGRLARSDKSIFSPRLLTTFKKFDRNSNVKLVWVGASTFARKTAKRLRLKNIIWVNPTQDTLEVAKLYNTFDIFCHFNALGETFGNTVAEAMLAGLPVVSLRGSRRYPQAQKEFLGETSQYFTSRRSARIQLEHLINDKPTRMSIGETNHELASELFSPKKLAQKVLEVYIKVLGQ